MSRAKIVELVELDPARKWQYLRRYYEVASRFYEVPATVVSDEEIEACLHRFKEKPTTAIRQEIQLQRWKFRFDPEEAGIRQGYFSFDCEDAGWETIAIPHSCRHIPADPVRYGRSVHDIFGTAEDSVIWYSTYDSWYRTWVTAGRFNPQEQIAYLRFDSVNLMSDVWLNENPVMLGHLGLFPFRMEVSEELSASHEARALVAVRARNIVTNKSYLFYNGLQPAYSSPPYTTGRLGEDWRDEAWSGIAGDVMLTIANRSHLEEVFIYTDEIADNCTRLTCQVVLANAGWTGFSGRVRVEISPWLPRESDVVEAVTQPVHVLPMNETRLTVPISLADASLWAIEEPNLYLAHVFLEDSEGKDVDDMYETFGVRTVKSIGSHFYINGKKTILRGTHDTTHYHDESLICPSDRIIVKDILLHKRLGANCSRWPSDKRMHYKRIAEYCDQLGFMLTWCGYYEMWTVHPEMEMYAVRDARAMVKSLRNCPSIVIWEMGDEPLLLIHDYRRYRWYEQVYDLVRAEDRSRPILPAGHFCLELIKMIADRTNAGLTPEQARAQVLEDYPVYNLELAYWDYHYSPMFPPVKPVHQGIDEVEAALGGQRPTVFTEFGLDALPEPDKVMDVYGRFRWGANPYWNRSRTEDDLACYGREISQQDWRETQASQAIALSSIIGHLRKSPDKFAGFYFMTMLDVWTFYQGVVDVNGNPKLGYFVARNLYQPLFVSGLGSDTVLKKHDVVEIVVSNYAAALSGASLSVQAKDSNNRIVQETRFGNLNIAGDVGVTPVARVHVNGMQPGLYSLEYHLQTQAGEELSRSIELFFLEE
jgi:hypothetical protein